MKIATQSTFLGRKIVSYATEDISPHSAASLQQEHTLIANKGRDSSVESENDKKDPIVSVAVQLSAAGAVGASTYAFISIPVTATQQEIAKKLLDIGADPEKAGSAAKFLIKYISDPNIRNIVISVATGVGFLTLIYKLDTPFWLKAALAAIVISCMLYLTHAYLPNRTPAKLDKHPAVEKVK